MNKIKLGLLAVVMMIFISNLVGCNSVQKVENLSSPTDAVKPKQTNTVNQVTKSPSETTTSSTNMVAKKEHSENLCTDEEEVLFSFQIENSPKTLSVCLSKNQSDYIVYRFGTKDNIELEFPQDKVDSWNKFTYSYYLRGGGAGNEGQDLNYLAFDSGGYAYQIYQEYTAKDNSTVVGIKITDKATNKETDIKGLSSSIKGSLINLRGNTKIKTEIQ